MFARNGARAFRCWGGRIRTADTSGKTRWALGLACVPPPSITLKLSFPRGDSAALPYRTTGLTSAPTTSSLNCGGGAIWQAASRHRSAPSSRFFVSQGSPFPNDSPRICKRLRFKRLRFLSLRRGFCSALVSRWRRRGGDAVSHPNSISIERVGSERAQFRWRRQQDELGR